MADRILGVGEADRKPDPHRRVVSAWDDRTKYRVAGWVGLVLMLAALTDYAMALTPLGLGSPEWEMSTIGAVVQGLPLFSIGVTGLWVAAGGLGNKPGLWVVGVGCLLMTLVLLGSLLLFVTDVPMAIRATQGVARLGIDKLIVRTLVLGLLFAASYVVSGVLSLKQARGNL